MIDRRSLSVFGLAAAASVSAPAVLRAQNRVVSWVTHPAIFAATGDGELLKKFEAQTGVKVEAATFPTETLGQRLQQELVARSAAFDVMSMADAFWTTSVARFCQPLDDLIKSSPIPNGGLADFAPGMVQQFRVPQTADGPIIGIPQRISVSLLYYRDDLLKAAGLVPPKTLDEFVAAGKALTKDGMHGVVFQGAQGQVGVLDWYEFAAPLGVDMLAPPDWKKAAFDTPAGVRALELRRKLIVDGIANQGVVAYGFDDAINAVAQQKAAMSVMFSAYWPRFEDAKTSQVVGKVAYAAPMRDPGVDLAYPARGWGLMINGASAKKDAAWEFIKFLTDAPQQKWMVLNKGNPVSRVSVARDPDVASALPIAKALSDALPHAKIMPNAPQLPRVYDSLSRHLGAALSGGASAADALKAARAEVDKLLG
jgi:multiple sugar transport system substrate-binding protein